VNFEGYTLRQFEIFGSMMDEEDITKIPVGLSPLMRNVRFHGSSVRTRDGLSKQWGISTGRLNPITGGASLVNPLTLQQVPLIFDQQGGLWVESPAGSGTLVSISNSTVSLPPGSMQISPAFIGAYLALTNLLRSTALPAVYNLTTGFLDPLSLRPLGQAWQAATRYVVGECICSALTPNLGRVFRCTTAGITGAAEPAGFQTAGDGSVIAEVAPGTAVWTENTPVFALAVPGPDSIGIAGPIAGNFFTPTLGTKPTSGFTLSTTRVPGAGAFAAGRDIYLAATLRVPDQSGVEIETNGVSGIVFQNTVLNDRFQVKVATVLRSWLTNLPPAFAPLNWELYQADVATGAASPALSTYRKVAGGPQNLALGTTVNVDNTAGGTVFPVVGGTSALVAPSPGNVPWPTGVTASGAQRWMVVLFVNRNGYISGMTSPSAVEFNVAGGLAGAGPSHIPVGFNNGAQIRAVNIPLGPTPHTAQRILAFTAAGSSSAGPYFYVPANDVSNGIAITSTVINDNVTTSGVFNFTDTYLQALIGNANVTNNFRLIQLPGCADIQFMRSIGRLLYQADVIPDGWYVSLANNPEAVYGDTGLVIVAQGNSISGRAITSREWRGQVYLLKERSGYVMSPGSSDPSTWSVQERWVGSGPCGSRAVDVCSRFMAYAHRSGLYIYQGNQPYPITREISKLWARINWNFAQNIVVHVDDEEKEIRVAVPLDQSILNNVILKCNYRQSHDPTLNEEFAAPFHMSFSGKLVASPIARKWSIDDIAANVIFRAERTLVNPAPLLDASILNTQIMLGGSNADGTVNVILPYVYNDNGGGIDCVIETATHEELMAVNQLGGVQLNGTPAGDNFVEVLFGRSVSPESGGTDPQLYRQLQRVWNRITSPVGYSCGANGQNERFRLRIHNNRIADAGFDIQWAAIYARKISGARPGV